MATIPVQDIQLETGMTDAEWEDRELEAGEEFSYLVVRRAIDRCSFIGDDGVAYVLNGAVGNILERTVLELTRRIRDRAERVV